MKVAFRIDDTIQIFRLGTTSNKKIASKGEKIVQSYSFAKDQFEEVQLRMVDSSRKGTESFFKHDAAVCGDCPFSVNDANGGKGGCYTHKGHQYFGFISTLKSLAKQYGSFQNIPEYSDQVAKEIIEFSVGRYVRFGSYGEPSLHPIELVKAVTAVAKNWTGYTHQYFRKPEYSEFFMASVHNQAQANSAMGKFNYRSFIAVDDNSDIEAIVCPASNEGGFTSNCSKCGLCSGAKGKGKKDIVILEH